MLFCGDCAPISVLPVTGQWNLRTSARQIACSSNSTSLASKPGCPKPRVTTLDTRCRVSPLRELPASKKLRAGSPVHQQFFSSKHFRPCLWGLLVSYRDDLFYVVCVDGWVHADCANNLSNIFCTGGSIVAPRSNMYRVNIFAAFRSLTVTPVKLYWIAETSEKSGWRDLIFISGSGFHAFSHIEEFFFLPKTWYLSSGLIFAVI
jgi:hypothetical protein